VYTINLEALDGYHTCMMRAPKIFLSNIAKAYGDIGRTDIKQLMESLPGKFNIRAKGLMKAFKSKATDPGKATDITKIFADEYTGWKAAAIFQTGGTITGKGKELTILFADARNANGRRKYTQAQLRQMIASGKCRFVPTPRGVLIVQSIGGLTKKGEYRKNTRDIILGILKHSIVEKKRLDFYENVERNSSLHQEILEYAIEDTLAEISVADKELG
jgi:hypothetical protein